MDVFITSEEDSVPVSSDPLIDAMVTIDSTVIEDSMATSDTGGPT